MPLMVGTLVCSALAFLLMTRDAPGRESPIAADEVEPGAA